MSTGLKNSSLFVLAFAFFAAFSAAVANAATLPEQLDAQILALDERIFAIDPSKLSERELAFYDDAKRYLADARLNLKFGNYEIVEELLKEAQNRLDLISSVKAEMDGKPASKATLVGISLIALVAIILGLLYVVVWPQSHNLPVEKEESQGQIQEQATERCPNCNGKMYKNVCVWCSFKRQNRP